MAAGTAEGEGEGLPPPPTFWITDVGTGLNREIILISSPTVSKRFQYAFGDHRLIFKTHKQRATQFTTN